MGQSLFPKNLKEFIVTAVIDDALLEAQEIISHLERCLGKDWSEESESSRFCAKLAASKGMTTDELNHYLISVMRDHIKKLTEIEFVINEESDEDRKVLHAIDLCDLQVNFFRTIWEYISPKMKDKVLPYLEDVYDTKQFLKSLIPDQQELTASTTPPGRAVYLSERDSEILLRSMEDQSTPSNVLVSLFL